MSIPHLTLGNVINPTLPWEYHEPIEEVSCRHHLGEWHGQFFYLGNVTGKASTWGMLLAQPYLGNVMSSLRKFPADITLGNVMCKLLLEECHWQGIYMGNVISPSLPWECH